jgi:Zn-dependent peptidase ImmA (M78 family)
MLIPKTFAINGSIWNVEYKWNLTYNKQPVDGLCDPVSKTIFIDRSLSKEDKFWTFVHEWMHAVLEENGIGHNSEDPDNKLTTDQEDRIIATFEAEIKRSFNIKWRKAL